MSEKVNFSLRNIANHQLVSLSDFTGKPVILQFWVSWCPDCMREVPLLNQFYESMRSEQIVVISINVSGREGSSEQRDEFISRNHISIPVLKDKGTEVYDQFGCKGVPTTVLLSADHTVQEVYGDKDTFPNMLHGISGLLTR
ncbi:TlpA disulfide reductase family protein [Pseudalkalibacillus berkeleyi]|uniref:TlpA family protein disulfide reductase n=1 Tax=Pseudalkalibacillus berkeleyi TaxID=1069813 RepID=A0ABS9H0P4_9BACL|nr:TlpA disulfide reductase family protein [Pseudalkalibacillus berkeleyi]MCF6138572.1 TlpA family protein disulfide reductase [Pseudalkalibacillus berkeleyi]